jgi:hypothetical protein
MKDEGELCNKDFDKNRLTKTVKEGLGLMRTFCSLIYLAHASRAI